MDGEGKMRGNRMEDGEREEGEGREGGESERQETIHLPDDWRSQFIMGRNAAQRHTKVP